MSKEIKSKWDEQEKYVDSLSNNPKILKQHLLLQIRLLDNMTHERDFLEKILKRNTSILIEIDEERKWVAEKLREDIGTQ